MKIWSNSIKNSKKCLSFVKKTKKYLKEFIHKCIHTKNWLKQSSTNIHNWCVDNKTYSKTGYELLVITLNGFFIWIMVFPFVNTNPIWFIPSYGIIPWFIIKFKSEWVNTK